MMGVVDGKGLATVNIHLPADSFEDNCIETEVGVKLSIHIHLDCLKEDFLKQSDLPVKIIQKR